MLGRFQRGELTARFAERIGERCSGIGVVLAIDDERALAGDVQTHVETPPLIYVRLALFYGDVAVVSRVVLAQLALQDVNASVERAREVLSVPAASLLQDEVSCTRLPECVAAARYVHQFCPAYCGAVGGFGPGAIGAAFRGNEQRRRLYAPQLV